MDTNLELSQNSASTQAEPRIVALPPLLLAGLRIPLDETAQQAIPNLWQRFATYLGKIPEQQSNAAYGLCLNSQTYGANPWIYMAACAVADLSDLPAELSPLILPSQRYAVFEHKKHLSQIRETINQAFDQWLPTSGFQLASKADSTLHFFERYGEDFNPVTGWGEIEIWLPIEHEVY
jgi:AraC family transcriptional regulator